MRVVLVNGDIGTTSELDFVMVDNNVRFRYEGVNYDIQLMYEDNLLICSVIKLGFISDKTGYVEYTLHLDYEGTEPGYVVSYNFDSVDLIKYSSIELTIHTGKDKYIVESNLPTITRPVSQKDFILVAGSWSSSFSRPARVENLLEFFECKRIDYIMTDGKIIMDIGTGYLVVEDNIFRRDAGRSLKTTECYSCEYNGYMYYMADFRDKLSTVDCGFDFRVIVKDGVIVRSLENSETILNKRLI